LRWQSAPSRRPLPAVRGGVAGDDLSSVPAPFGGQCREGGDEVDAGDTAAERQRGHACGTGAAERFEHDAAGLIPRLDARGRDLVRERGEMRRPVGPGRDRADVTWVAAIRVSPAAPAVAGAAGGNHLAGLCAVLEPTAAVCVGPPIPWGVGAPGGRRESMHPRAASPTAAACQRPRLTLGCSTSPGVLGCRCNVVRFVPLEERRELLTDDIVCRPRRGRRIRPDACRRPTVFGT